MASHDPASAFARFRDAVHEDDQLATWLHQPRPRDAFVALVVKAGAERGFTFDAAAVRAAMREGEARWLKLGAEIA